MNEHATVSWLQALKVYWASMWRTMLVMFGAVVLVAPIYALFIEMLLGRPSLVEMLLRLGMVLLGLALAAGWAAKSALTVRYSDFVIKASAENAPGGEVPITLWVGVRFWWAYLWRTLLLAMPISMFVQYAMHGTLLPGPASMSDQVLYIALTWPVHISASVWAVRLALTLKYGVVKLHVQQLRAASVSDEPPPQPTAG